MLAKLHGHVRSLTIFEKLVCRGGYSENNIQRLIYESNFLVNKKKKVKSKRSKEGILCLLQVQKKNRKKVVVFH
jgi:hypothetical protein